MEGVCDDVVTVIGAGRFCVDVLMQPLLGVTG